MANLEDLQMMDLLFHGHCYPTKDTTGAKNLDGDAREFQVYLAWQPEGTFEDEKCTTASFKTSGSFPSYNILTAL